MPDPVLVVHGVAQRDPAPFHAQVSALQAALGTDRWQLIPVFWGDLGGRDEGLADTLPGGASPLAARAVPGERIPLPRPASGRLTMRTRVDAVVSGAAETRPAAATARAGGSLRSAVAAALPRTHTLRTLDDPDTLREIGRLLAAALEPEAEGVQPAIAVHLPGKVKEILDHLDAVVGSAVSHAIGRYVHNLRASAASPFSRFFGDMLAYQRNAVAIQQRLWDALPGDWGRARPVNVIAHSFGGIISVDASLPVPAVDAGGHPRPALRIGALVTFGSQPAFFHVLDPRHPPLPVYRTGHPVPLPNVGRWVNLWEPMDFLAFLASPVFTTAEGAPTDLSITATARELERGGLYTHSLYWKRPELVTAIRQAFGGGPA